jgi:arabinose-5-phosphate isomerase
MALPTSAGTAPAEGIAAFAPRPAATVPANAGVRAIKKWFRLPLRPIRLNWGKANRLGLAGGRVASATRHRHARCLEGCGTNARRINVGHTRTAASIEAVSTQGTGEMAATAERKKARHLQLLVSHPADSAARTLDLEREGLEALRTTLNQQLREPFRVAVATLAAARGRVIVTGIGKSGHVGQKVAATFASTGTPAFFVHPSEASHGDLGMITRDDAIVAISWSGESVELGNILTYSRRFKVPLIAITSRSDSALGKQSDVVLEMPRAKEACPHGLAPTTSTTMQLAMGDCLAIALLEAKGFTAHDFSVFHPGGSLGASLKFVADIMHTGDRLPLVGEDRIMSEALVTMTQKSFGCLGVIDGKGRLVGMITDGDLRRHMGPELLKQRVSDIMTRKPNTLSRDMLASAALQQINALKRTQMFVVDKGKPVGVVHVHDLLRAGVA